MISKGDKVNTRLGRGKVASVDTTTYSIPIFVVELTDGIHAGEKIAICNGDFTTIED